MRGIFVRRFHHRLLLLPAIAKLPIFHVELLPFVSAHLAYATWPLGFQRRTRRVCTTGRRLVGPVSGMRW